MYGMSSGIDKCTFKRESRFLTKPNIKKRIWRSLKQITAAERTLLWPPDAVLYYSINTPPTFKPVKKYSDISGLPAPYVDRHSNLFYSNAEEFATVRSLPMDITAGYLQLRGVNTLVG